MTVVDLGSSVTMCNTKMGLMPGRIGRYAQRPHQPSFTVSGGIGISSASELWTTQAMLKPGHRDMMPGRMCGDRSDERW